MMPGQMNNGRSARICGLLAEMRRPSLAAHRAEKAKFGAVAQTSMGRRRASVDSLARQAKEVHGSSGNWSDSAEPQHI